MIEAVFLCDTKWKIKKVRQCNEKLDLKEGEDLINLVLEKEDLQNHTENHYSLELTFPGKMVKIPALIDSYKEGKLVILASVQNDQELLELHRACLEHQEWAKNHLMGLYHDEYFLIQQLNNQLVDTQRRLARSNRQLEAALKEKQAMNEKLERDRKAAEQASRSKSRFLANMSHDIRTPMNAIVGLSELMQHSLTEPQILKNYILKLQSSSRYLLDLLNDILDLSKIENGSSGIKLEPMNLGAQIEQIVTIMRPQINKKKQLLSVESDRKTFEPLLADPVRFRQVLMNLFSNAMKYTPEGGKIGFSIQTLSLEERKQRYRFVVEDSGIGMSSEFVRHIFEPFARAESEVKEIQGTGLGMAITKNIVDAMGGTIQVYSTPGKGSRFELELSFEVCSEAVLPESAEPVSEKETEAAKEMKEKTHTLRGMHFLCAEDNELNAEILSSMLALEGASCDIYGNGKLLAEAFEMVKPGEYDAILMDVQMPVMNGYEAARRIRGSVNPLGKKIPIIAMTANAFSEDIEHCRKAGMDAHIAKPINMEVLIQTLEEICCTSVARRFV